MIICKLLGCTLVFLSCSLAGYAFKNKTLLRVGELENMMSCMKVLENEIRVSMSDITAASSKVLEVAQNSNVFLFENLISATEINDGQTLSELWKKSVLSIIGKSYYSESDIKLFMRFGDVLGSGDAQSQIDNLKIFRTDLSKELEDARGEVDQKGTLYGKIGVYIGVISVILLI